jgi:hypothetical protein
MDYPRLSTPITLSLVAVLALAVAWRQPNLPDWLKTVLIWSGFILLFFALITLANWMAEAYTSRVNNLQEARSKTERVELLKIIAKMTPDQVQVIEHWTPVVEVLVGTTTGPVFQLKTHSGTVPMAFVSEFLDAGTEFNLAAVRSWPDKTIGRRYAQEVTDFLIYLGFAAPAAGNQAARWVDYQGAMLALGLMDNAGQKGFVN